MIRVIDRIIGLSVCPLFSAQPLFVSVVSAPLEGFSFVGYFVNIGCMPAVNYEVVSRNV